MNKKTIIFIFLIVLLCECSGCTKDKNLIKNNKKNETIEDLNLPSIFKLQEGKNEFTSSDYQKVKMKCNALNEIVDVSLPASLFITKDGSLYEYSYNKLYSTTKENCRKINTNMKFKKFLYGDILAENGKYYIYEAKENTNGILVPIEESESLIRRIPPTNIDDKRNLTYTFDTYTFDKYNLLENRNVYTINQNKKDLIFTIPENENIEYMVDEVIKTNKHYYNYVEENINEKECMKYEDIECIYKPKYKITKFENDIKLNFYDTVRFYKPGGMLITYNGDVYLWGLGG